MQLRSYYEIGLPDINRKLLHLTWVGVAYNSCRWTEVVGRRFEVCVCLCIPMLLSGTGCSFPHSPTVSCG